MLDQQAILGGSQQRIHAAYGTTSAGAGMERLYLSAVILMTLSSVGTAQQSTGRSLPDILRKTASYVARFQQDFARVIADEDYDQTQDTGHNVIRRTMHSEVLSVWIAAQRGWMWARNPITVNGRPVPDSRVHLDRLLDADLVDALKLSKLRDEGARFNLGGVYHNFNDPTFVIGFLDRSVQPRFNFKLEGMTKIAGRTAAKLAFVERQRPTLIRSHDRDAPASGTVWIDADSGAVVRTRLDVKLYSAAAVKATGGYSPDPVNTVETSAEVDVDYVPDAALDLCVPREMREDLVAALVMHGQSRTVIDHVKSVARYSNARKFTTAARIVPQH